MTKIKENIAKINSDYDALNKQFNTGNCWQLSTTMQDLEGTLREHIQEITKNEISQIIKKLESNTELSNHELDYIKLWMVGDAEYYVKLENNYNDWLEELKRLINEINKFETSQPDFNDSSNLRAMVLDAIRVLGDILFFIKQQERVKNFTESTKEINPQERDLLIQLLKGKIASPNE